MNTKKVLTSRRDVAPHWVGDGFPVRSLFSYQADSDATSPFLLLDYAGPAKFDPADRTPGVGEHPHRGFETVTIVYQGELEHRDSGGNHGSIGPGDVQWMTAASGVVHEEFHSKDFTQNGGTLEMVQLWVNLPAKDKMSPPKYQGILSATIPSVGLPHGSGTVRVIAGEFQGTKGPAATFTPINVWDIQISGKDTTTLHIPSGHNTALVVQRGTVTINREYLAHPVELVIFEREGEEITLECSELARVLLLSGEPIEEPLVGQGPFVMNSRQEISQAIADYKSGKMGHL